MNKLKTFFSIALILGLGTIFVLSRGEVETNHGSMLQESEHAAHASDHSQEDREQLLDSKPDEVPSLADAQTGRVPETIAASERTLNDLRSSETTRTAFTQGGADTIDSARQEPQTANWRPNNSARRQGRLADPEYRAARVAELQGEHDAAQARAREWAERTGSPMRIETNDTVIILVDYDEKLGPIYRSTRNVNAAISSAADLVMVAPYNLSGAGITAGIWDGGNVRASHTEFVSGRVTNYNSASLNNHATHVAGTMIARGASSSARGMATNAHLLAYDFNNDLTEMTLRALADPQDTDGRIQISNHSYGFLAGWESGSWSGSSGRHWWGTWGNTESDFFGMYYNYDRDIDLLVYDALYYLPIKSAGNDRNDAAPSNGTTFYRFNTQYEWVSDTYNSSVHPGADGQKGGYDTIPFGGVAKNILLVGAVNDAVSGGERNLANATQSPFSSWGPTDDGRIKPDVVGNGVGLTSSSASSDTDYYGSSGTSMSAPNVSGSALLLLEQFNNYFPGELMWASTIKGLVIHTADSLSDPGPDYRNGWGLMNTQAAVDKVSAHAQSPSAGRIIEDVITNGSTISYTVYWNEVDDLWATLVWTDPPGTPVLALNNTSPRLVNDLDLRIISPSGTTNFPWILNPSSPSTPATTGDNFRDNVEQVYISDPGESGLYTILITHKGTLSGGEQLFSLITSGVAEPLRLEGDLDFNEVFVGSEAQRILTIHNPDSNSATVTNIVTSAGFSTDWVGSIPSGASRDVVITFAPDEEALFDGSVLIQWAESSLVASAPVFGSGIVSLAITNPVADLTVPYATEILTFSGAASGNLVGSLAWTNELTGLNGSVAVAPSWTVSDVLLDVGENLFHISGTNDPVIMVLSQDSAATTWGNGDNGGFGFNEWTLQASGTNAGHFVATSENNTNLNISSPAWGLYANNGAEANAYRPLAQPLAIGDTFEMDFENNWVESGASVGMALLNADGEWVFELYFVGGQSHYRINDSVTAFETPLAYTDEGVTLRLTRTGQETYEASLNGSTLSERSFAARDHMEITRLRVFNSNAAGSASPGSSYDLFFNNLSMERAAAAPQVFDDEVTITRLGPPPDAPDIFIDQVEDSFIQVSWTTPVGATGYVLDVHTDASFTSSEAGAGGFEGFADTGPVSSTFRTIAWTNNGIEWIGYNARNSDTMTGAALGLRDASGAYLISAPIPGGVDELSIDYTRPSGNPNPAGTISILVNGVLIGGPYTLQNSTQTATISGIGEYGPATIMITNSGSRVAIIDNLTWTNEGAVVGAFVPGYSNFTTTLTNEMVTGLEPGSEYFFRVKAVSENGESGYALTNATTLGEARETQTITFDSIEGDIVTTNVVELSASASSGLPVTFTVLSGPAQLIHDTTQLVFNASGEVSVQASQEGNDDYQPAPHVTRSFFVNKATPVLITLPTPDELSPGQSLADANLIGGEANVDGDFEWQDDTIAPPLGTSSQTVVFIPDDPILFNPVQDDLEVTVRYPIFTLDPDSDQSLALLPLDQTNLVFTIGNAGDAELNWTASVLSYDFYDDVESGVGEWSFFGNNMLWDISTNRSASGDASWHSGYTSFMQSWLIMPPVWVHTNQPLLSIDHWIDAEVMDSFVAYDGGFVAISTNGIDFFLLEPEHGYPYALDQSSLRVFSGQSDWTNAVFDLSGYAGELVEIAFIFDTLDVYDGIKEGWYIDNILVYSGAEPDWISLSDTVGSVSMGNSSHLTAHVSAPAHYAESSQQALLSVDTDDPVNPDRTVQITLDVLSTPPSVDILSVVQTSTNASGEVTIVVDVEDPDSPEVDLAVEFSLDEGGSWMPAAMVASDAGIVSNASPQIVGVEMNDGSNQVAAVWSTTNVVTLSTSTLVRVRGSDRVVWGDWSVSDPFLVDNEPPSVPAALSSMSHTAALWSASRSLTASWEAANDGDGVGVAYYLLEVDNGIDTEFVSSSNLTVTVNDLADGTNWMIRVSAVDAFGNQGAFSDSLGPFWIDATPPDAFAAIVTIESSEFGVYTLSSILTNSWEGFEDALSGIAGYYAALNDNSSPETHLWTVAPQASLIGAVWNETNHVYVWAVDEAGNISDPATASILVLEPSATQPGALMTNKEKEIAGLDATNPDANFEGSPVQSDQLDEFGNPLPTLQWPWATNRLYRIIWGDGPLSAAMSWTTNTLSAEDYTVEAGVARWTDTNSLQGVQNRYYRIQVELVDE